MTPHWLPRSSDRMVVLSPQGRPISTWLVTFAHNVTPGEITLTLAPEAGQATTEEDPHEHAA